MQNPFLTLGIPATTDADVIHAAYRRLVKACHPDAVLDEMQKQHAQERMIALNLAYEQALKTACRPVVQMDAPPLADTLRLAQKLMDRGLHDSALRTLERNRQCSASWYYLYGCALHGIQAYARAHQSLRHAVHMEPDNKLYRIAALHAFTAERDSHKLSRRVTGWAKGVLQPKR